MECKYSVGLLHWRREAGWRLVGGSKECWCLDFWETRYAVDRVSRPVVIQRVLKPYANKSQRRALFAGWV